MTIFLISTFAALLPITVYILFLRWLDRYEREPLGHLLVTFVLGATISVGFSFVANTIVGMIGKALMTQAGSTYFLASLVAPIVEETNKGIIVVLFAWLSREFDNLTDGILYGAVVGLGFAFSENVMYFLRIYHESGPFAWIRNMYIRSFFLAGVHASATALFGACLASARHSKWSERLAAILIGWGLAVMVHSFWNSVLTVSELSKDPVLAILPFVGLPIIFFVLFVFFQISLSRESQMIEEELTGEANTGLLPSAHIPILRSYIRRDRTGWFQDESRRLEYIQQATNLAFTRNRYWHLPLKKREACQKEINSIREKIKQLLGGEKGGLPAAILVVIGCLSFFTAIAVFGLWIWNKLLIDFPAYQGAQTFLSNHTKVLELIGPVNQWDTSPSGGFYYNDRGGDGELKMNIVGSKGSGRVELKLHSDFGETWKIERAILKIAAQKDPIELEGPRQWLDSATRYMNQRKFVEAQGACDLIRKSAPDDDRADACFAELALAQGDSKKQVEVRKRLAELYPRYAAYQTSLAYAYYTSGDNQKSIEHYKKSWELSPNPETASSIAYVYLNAGESHPAWEWLEKAKGKGLRSASLAYRYGWYHYSKKDYKTATEFFNISRQTDPNYVMAHFGLAYAARDQGKKAEAIYHFEEGIQRSPYNSLVHRRHLIELLIDAKYFDEAIYHLIRTTLYHPREVTPYVILSKLYERQGRTANADHAVGLARQIDPIQTEQISNRFNYLAK